MHINVWNRVVSARKEAYRCFNIDEEKEMRKEGGRKWASEQTIT